MHPMLLNRICSDLKSRAFGEEILLRDVPKSKDRGNKRKLRDVPKSKDGGNKRKKGTTQGFPQE
jgi:hypothetical protein